jgi:hypothetical protein
MRTANITTCSVAHAAEKMRRTREIQTCVFYDYLNHFHCVDHTGMFWLGCTLYLSRFLLFLLMLLLQTQRYTAGLVCIFYRLQFFVKRSIIVYVKRIHVATTLFFSFGVKPFERIWEHSYGFRSVCRRKIRFYNFKSSQDQIVKWRVGSESLKSDMKVGSQSLKCDIKSGHRVTQVRHDEWEWIAVSSVTTHGVNHSPVTLRMETESLNQLKIVGKWVARL